MIKAECREWPRASINTVVRVLGRDGRPHSYVCKNLSAGGALIVGESALAVGDDVQVDLALRGLRVLHVRARVLRIEAQDSESPRCALRFVDVRPNAQDLIQDHVLVLLRKAKAQQHLRRLRPVDRLRALDGFVGRRNIAI